MRDTAAMNRYPTLLICAWACVLACWQCPSAAQADPVPAVTRAQLEDDWLMQARLRFGSATDDAAPVLEQRQIDVRFEHDVPERCFGVL